MENYNYIEKLVQKAKNIIKENHKTKRKTCSEFNIFSVLDIEKEKVLTHSNMIYSFLNSESGHCMEDKYLKIFLETVLGMKKHEVSQKWYVERDWSFDNGKIDFVIYNDNYFIAIEMKIDAEDQSNQLKIYDDYAKTREGNYKIYYLTLDGEEPNSQSEKDIETKIKLISFDKHILDWLQKCIDKTSPLTDVYDALNQYGDLVTKIANKEQKIIC